jgi:hypothetical protein
MPSSNRGGHYGTQLVDNRSATLPISMRDEVTIQPQKNH